MVALLRRISIGDLDRQSPSAAENTHEPGHRRAAGRGHGHARRCRERYPRRALPAVAGSVAVAGPHFVLQARERAKDPAMADSTGVELTYGEPLLRALALGRVLARDARGAETYVGLLVPPTVPAAVANLALTLLGKIPVNLNYTASQAVVDSVDRPVRDHARPHLAEGPRQVQDHAQGDADLPRRPPEAGHGRPTSSGPRRSRKARPDRRCWGRSCPGLQGRRPRRDGHGDLHLGLDRRPEGGRPLAPERPEQRPPDRTAPRPAARRGRAGILPFFHSFGFTVDDLDGPLPGQEGRSTTSTRSTPGSSATSARSTGSR